MGKPSVESTQQNSTQGQRHPRGSMVVPGIDRELKEEVLVQFQRIDRRIT